jgi:ssDNA-binding Zn-finger/Zn-ribbon topoisomerase 1
VGNGATALPGAKPPTAQAGGQPGTQPSAKPSSGKPGAPSPAKPGAKPGEPPGPNVANHIRTDLLARVWDQSKKYRIEMGLVPVVFLGMVLVHRIRRRNKGDDFFIPMVGMMAPAESEPFDQKHPVHRLGAEEFELLIALIYQRQGYRVSMPAALGGGRGGDFLLLRKSERILVQCKKLDLDHQVPVDRVRELHDSLAAASATRGMYVVSCAFSWDARNFGKAKGMTLINARTLDQLITAAQETPAEDLLDVAQWIPRLMSKVQFTPPVCPACEAAMDQVTASHGAVWVCSQRPDCRGRRSARKYQKPDPAAARKTDPPADPSPAPSVPQRATQPTARPATQPAVKSSAQPAPKSAAPPATKPTAKPVAKPEAQSATKSKTQPAAKPATKTDTKTEPRPAAESAALFTAYPSAKPAPKPADKQADGVNA